MFEREQKRSAAKKGSSDDLALSIRAASQRRMSGGILGAVLSSDVVDPLAGRDLQDVRTQQSGCRVAGLTTGHTKRPASKSIKR